MNVKISGLEQKQNEWIFEDLIKFCHESIYTEKKILHPIKNLELIFEDMHEDDNGICEEVLNRDSTYNVKLTLNKNHDFLETINTLSHEMIHVKQLETGRLKTLYYGDGSYTHLWEGVAIEDAYEFDVPIKMSLMPWEEEAHTMEKDVYRIFLGKMSGSLDDTHQYRLNYDFQTKQTNIRIN